ncbi:MAG: translation initiation factor [Bacteroidota bacterium]|nr:translation initiation factor [Bacteroidota bacterium]
MAKKKNNARIGVVYSTNSEFIYQENKQEEAETLPPQQQLLKVMLDKKMRAGKQVTLVAGFVGKEEDLNALGKLIKTKCGVGGTVKEGEVVIQGDFREKIYEILSKASYKIKKVG